MNSLCSGISNLFLRRIKTRRVTLSNRIHKKGVLFFNNYLLELQLFSFYPDIINLTHGVSTNNSITAVGTTGGHPALYIDLFISWLAKTYYPWSIRTYLQNLPTSFTISWFPYIFCSCSWMSRDRSNRLFSGNVCVVPMWDKASADRSHSRQRREDRSLKEDFRKLYLCVQVLEM